MSDEELYESMMNCLKEAETASMWAFWRDRFNTNHPEHIRREEIENPNRYATVNFYLAKRIYCDNTEAMDRIHASQQRSVSERDRFSVMKQVIDKELEEQVENLLTEEIDMSRKSFDDFDPIEEEVDTNEFDEDEEYVRSTQDPDDEELWDGDEFIAGGDIDDEEYVDDDYED